MSQAFSTVALIGKCPSREVANSIVELSTFLHRRGCTTLVEQATAAALEGACGSPASYAEIGRRADLAVVLGGDGSMLNAARHLAEHGVPLVGINQGRLGFMTDISRQDMLRRIDDLLEGRYRPERRSLMLARILRDGACVFQTPALNDVVVSKGEVGRMIEFELRIDDEFVYNQRSDGLIVSTPTGSTAYALSANGPILHPAVAGIAIVPLCPHTLSARPVTICDDSVIEITLAHPHEARVRGDGQTHFDLRPGDCVRVSRAPGALVLLHPPGYSYFAMLREKLRWSEAPSNQ